MAPKHDQFFKDKFAKYLQEKTENDDAYSDEEYDTEENISGRLGGLGIPHDDDLDVPHGRTGTGIGGISRGIGGMSLGGRGLGSLGGRTGGSLGGLGSLSGRGLSNPRGGGMVSRGGLSGLGGLGRGKPSQSVSSSDNVRLSLGHQGVRVNAGLESGTVADFPKDSGENMSKALGDIAKGTTALQKEVAAFISDSQQKNVEAFKEILHFVHGLEDRTVVHFKELSRLNASAPASASDSHTVPVDEALQALISNIDKTLKDKNKDTVYILYSEAPESGNDSVDISEVSKLLGKKNVQIVDNVRSLCDNIMSDSEDTAPEKPTTSLPVQVANTTPYSSPSKGFPPLRSPIVK